MTDSLSLDQKLLLKQAGYSENDIDSMTATERMSALTELRAKANECFRTAAKAAGITEAEMLKDSFERLTERINVAIHEGTYRDAITVKLESPAQSVMFDGLRDFFAQHALIEDELRLSRLARKRLKSASRELAEAYIVEQVVESLRVFASGEIASGRESDISANRVYRAHFKELDPRIAPKRSLRQMLTLEQLGYAGVVENMLPAQIVMPGLSDEEVFSRMANRASLEVVTQVAASCLLNLEKGMASGLRNRLKGVNRDAKEIVVREFCEILREPTRSSVCVSIAVEVVKQGLLEVKERTILATIDDSLDTTRLVKNQKQVVWTDAYVVPWHWGTRIASHQLTDEFMRFGGQTMTKGDTLTSTMVFGRSGSGKTSTLSHNFLTSFIRSGYGIVLYCAKPSDRTDYERIARLLGRGDDLVIVSTRNEVEMLSNALFDRVVKEYLAKGELPPVGLLEDLFMDVIQTCGTNTSESRGSNQAFFDMMKSLLRGAINLLILAGEEVNIPNIGSLLDSRIEGDETEAWWRTAYQAYCLNKARLNMSRGLFVRNFSAEMTWEETQAFWLKEVPRYERQGGKSSFMQNCIGEFKSVSDVFMKNPTLRMLFSGRTDYCVEDAYKRGAIIIIDLPIEGSKPGKLMAKAAAGITTANAILAIQDREGDTNSDDSMIPFVLFSDEAHHIIITRFADILSSCRSRRACVFFLTQGVELILREFGKDSAHAVNSILMNVGTLITCQLGASATETKKLFEEAIGGFREKFYSNSGVSRSRQLLPSDISLGGVASMVGSVSNQTVDSYSEQRQSFIKPEYYRRLAIPTMMKPYCESIVVTLGRDFPDSPAWQQEEGQDHVEPQCFQRVPWQRNDWAHLEGLTNDELRKIEHQEELEEARHRGDKSEASNLDEVRDELTVIRADAEDANAPSSGLFE